MRHGKCEGIDISNLVTTACQNIAYKAYYYKEICHTAASVKRHQPQAKHQQIKLEYHCHSFVVSLLSVREAEPYFNFSVMI